MSEREPLTLDAYDRLLGSLSGCHNIGPAVKEQIEHITGLSQAFYVRTYREVISVDGDETRTRSKFTTFLRYIEGRSVMNIAIPHVVLDMMIAQRETLIKQAQRRRGKAAYANTQSTAPAAKRTKK